MLRIFLDTEFTQFRDGQLLSLGMVTDDGHELYVEVADPIRQARASEFCRHSVISQFGLVPGSAVRDDAAVGARVADWLSAFTPPVAIAYDYKLDWRFFESALRAAGQWQALASKLRAEDVAGVAAPGTPGESAQNAVFESSTSPCRHHALVDARALRAAWQAGSIQS
jgi:3' exoribonuclease, RNase T-like